MSPHISRQATADMRQLLALLRRLPRVRPPAGAPPLASAGTASRLRFDGVSFGYDGSPHTSRHLPASPHTSTPPHTSPHLPHLPTSPRRYDGSRRDLEDVSFEAAPGTRTAVAGRRGCIPLAKDKAAPALPAGTRTAIVGPSGSGKSSLLKLALRRLHGPAF